MGRCPGALRQPGIEKGVVRSAGRPLFDSGRAEQISEAATATTQSRFQGIVNAVLVGFGYGVLTSRFEEWRCPIGGS